MKALIYCRVSTKEQAELGYSLAVQERECRKFAEGQGLDIGKVFIERGESAKTQDRTELQKLIKYAVENKKDLSSLIIWKYDRLARNLSDQMELVKNFSSLGIRILSVTENNEDNSVGKLMRNIIGSFAQYENDIRSERTKKAMMQSILQGRWCWKAPAGYTHSRDNTNKPLLVPLRDHGNIVEAFELAEKGLYKQTEIVEKLRQKGTKTITKSLLNKVLRNPLYAGLIKVDWFPDYIDAIHKPIISKETFFRVQMLLDGKRPSIISKRRNHPDFPLRNFIRCPKCGQKLTGGWSTGRRGGRYAYYHCRTKGCSLNVKKAVLESKFCDYLITFQPNPDVISLFEAVVLDVWKQKQTDQIKEEARLEKQMKDLEQTKNRLDELIIKGVLDEETYKTKVEAIKNDITVKRIEINETKIELDDIESCLNFCKYFLSNIANLWETADLNLKQRFQTLIFPEKIYYDEKKFRTTATALIFKQMQDFSTGECGLVGPRGFEPRPDG